MAVHPRAGLLPGRDQLVRVPELMRAYYTEYPDPAVAEERVSFGTSGHRGTPLLHSFNEEHIYAITQAVCDYRAVKGIDGPLFLGADTHALSAAAFGSALEVLAANGVSVFIARDGAYTATPAVSHAILSMNAGRVGSGLADGIVITPSHNPPEDGGFKYNPPHGGPADTDVTSWIASRANEHLSTGNRDVQIMHLRAARKSSFVTEYDFTARYVEDLPRAVNMEAIAASGIRLAVDPLGGASLPLWEAIADRYRLNLTIVNREIDPTFRFVPCDKDGKIRMDCSSPYAMNRLLDLRDAYDLSFACDPDADRHGIVTPQGLMNPNHYLSAAAAYLFRTREAWPGGGIGKTLVTSGMLDHIAVDLRRPLIEVPVGFKWFVSSLQSGRCCFACEESAGASFLCLDGTPWSTDKDGPLLCLLAAEMTACEQRTPSEQYETLTRRFGSPVYQRLDAPADAGTRKRLRDIREEDVDMRILGGEPVTEILTHAPGNGAPIGGVKVCAESGWFAARPSGTEAICKVYTESFRDGEHLKAIQNDALAFMSRLLS